jgi:hypothetical protein
MELEIYIFSTYFCLKIKYCTLAKIIPLFDKLYFYFKNLYIKIYIIIIKTYIIIMQSYLMESLPIFEFIHQLCI